MGWAPEKIQTKKRRSEFGSHQAAAPGWALGNRMSLRGERRPLRGTWAWSARACLRAQLLAPRILTHGQSGCSQAALVFRC